MKEAEELMHVKEQAKFVTMLPYIEEHADKMRMAVETRVSAALSKGELTPEAALAAWMEVLSYRRLVASFKQRTNVGTSLGQKHAATLELARNIT